MKVIARSKSRNEIVIAEVQYKKMLHDLFVCFFFNVSFQFGFMSECYLPLCANMVLFVMFSMGGVGVGWV